MRCISFVLPPPRSLIPLSIMIISGLLNRSLIHCRVYLIPRGAIFSQDVSVLKQNEHFSFKKTNIAMFAVECSILPRPVGIVRSFHILIGIVTYVTFVAGMVLHQKWSKVSQTEEIWGALYETLFISCEFGQSRRICQILKTTFLSYLVINNHYDLSHKIENNRTKVKRIASHTFCFMIDG